MEYIISKNTNKDQIQISSLLKKYGGFFQDIHWKKWTDRIRERVITCMDDCIKCKSGEIGYAVYVCTWCWEKHVVCFTCKRRFCSSCSKPLCDKFINNIRKRLPTNISYIHITFTLPEELRDFWIQYRHTWVLNIIFQQAAKIIKDYFNEKFGITPGIFSMIHTFWSHVNWNPHLHLVCTLGGIAINSEEENERVNISEKYLSFKSFKKKRRALIAQECRATLKKYDPQNYDKRNSIINKLFKKSWYVQLSEPIIDVEKIMGYITRYMYRAPVSVNKIIDTQLTDDPHISTITIKYTHKKPREERTITYTVFDFIGMIFRQLPDKYFRSIRFYWLFAQNTRKHNIPKILTLAQKKQENSIQKRPTNFVDRFRSTFGVNPLRCHNCEQEMSLYSITFFSKRTLNFTTKYFDSG